MKICILGAGISGVSLARMLGADGHDVTVLEKSDRAGGLCKSRTIDGFTFDDAGGHILFSKEKKVLSWMQDRCGGDEGLVRTERHTKIRWHDRWVPYPFENGVGHLTKDAIVECMEGYIEAYVQRRLGTDCPSNFKDWIDWRMGDGFARHFMVPYNEKIWECNLSEMSSGWVAGRVPEAPIKDILESAVGVDSQGYTHQSVFWFPKAGGFEALVKGCLDQSFTLKTGVEIESVKKVGERFSVDGEDFDLVVNTVPLPQIEAVIKDIPAEIREEIRALKPISLVNVLIGVEVDEPVLPMSWIYLPFKEQGPSNRITYFSNYAPSNAPEGHASFMAEVTHRGDLEPTQAWMDELVQHIGPKGASILDPERVVLTSAVNSEYAYIDQNLQFQDRVDRVRDWFDKSGMVTFGRFGRYEYHNSDMCVARAMQAHEHISEIAASGAAARPQFD